MTLGIYEQGPGIQSKKYIDEELRTLWEQRTLEVMDEALVTVCENIKGEQTIAYLEKVFSQGTFFATAKFRRAGKHMLLRKYKINTPYNISSGEFYTEWRWHMCSAESNKAALEAFFLWIDLARRKYPGQPLTMTILTDNRPEQMLEELKEALLNEYSKGNLSVYILSYNEYGLVRIRFCMPTSHIQKCKTAEGESDILKKESREKEVNLMGNRNEILYADKEFEVRRKERSTEEIDATWPLVCDHMQGEVTADFIRGMFTMSSGTAIERINRASRESFEKNFRLNAYPCYGSEQLFTEFVAKTITGVTLERGLEAAIDWAIVARKAYPDQLLTVTIMADRWHSNAMSELERTFKVAYSNGNFSVNILYCNEYGLTNIPFYMNRPL